MLKFPIPEMVLGALFASLLWAGIWGWTDSYAPTERQKDECYESTQKTGQKSDECKTFWEKTTSDPVAFFTLVVGFSTIGLWVATIMLYFAGERQLALAKESAERQGVEIQNQIDIAREANRAAQKSADAAVAAERARLYVVIEHNFLACINAAANWDGPTEQEQALLPANIQPMAGISFKNYGKTPCIVIEVGTGILFSVTTPDHPVYDVRVVKDNIIASGDSTEKFGTIITGQMTIAEAQKVSTGEGYIWVFGYVSYDDVFGERQVHRFFQRLVCVSHYRHVLQAYDHKHYNYST